MENTNDFKVILEAMIDNSSLTNVQKQLAKERLKINADISVEDFAKSKQEIEKQIGKLAESIRTILGNAVSDKQASQWAKQYYNQMVSGAKQATKAQESLTDAMARGREKAEQVRIAEEKAANKRQQLAAANAVNKQLEDEYKQRQKNIQAAQKQAELDKQNALAFTKSASERLSSAISKYSYGDTSDANAMMKQMNRGLSDFGDLSNVQGNITQLSSAIDKIIADLKTSHEQSLQALNEEIKAEQTLQSQKDTFNKKNINAIDYEIQKREEESKAFSSMLQAQMQEEQKLADQANKIQLSFANGDYNAKVESTIAKTQQWVNANGEARISTNSLSTALSNLDKAYLAITADGGNTVANQKALKQAESELSAEIKKVTNDVTKMNAEYAKSSKVESLHQKLTEFYDKNSATHKKWGNELKQMMDATASGAKVTNSELLRMELRYKEIGNEARQTGKLGLSFFDGIKEQAKKFTQWVSVASVVTKGVQTLREMKDAVYDIDTAMTSLYKVTDETDIKYNEFLNDACDNAQRLGRSVSSLVEQTANWAKLGFNIDEASKLAEISSIYANVGEIDDATAVSDIVTAMKSFNIEAENSIDIVDKLNLLGKIYCPAM